MEYALAIAGLTSPVWIFWIVVRLALLRDNWGKHWQNALNELLRRSAMTTEERDMVERYLAHTSWPISWIADVQFLFHKYEISSRSSCIERWVGFLQLRYMLWKLNRLGPIGEFEFGNEIELRADAPINPIDAMEKRDFLKTRLKWH